MHLRSSVSLALFAVYLFGVAICDKVPITAEQKAALEGFKSKGDKALKENNFEEAVSAFTSAIEIDPGS